MAETFDVIGQREDIEFLGGTKTRPVITVSIVTKPSGVYVEYRIPRKIYSAAEVKNEGIAYSGTVEAVADVKGVTGLVYGQRPKASGELEDIFTVTVESTSGESSAEIVVPFGQFSPALVTPKVKALRAQLDAGENL